MRAHMCEIINYIFAISGRTLLQTLKRKDVLFHNFLQILFGRGDVLA